jgi:TetR/AcrR family transcriptional repressor of nem operon
MARTRVPIILSECPYGHREICSLPEQVRAAVQAFFEENERWLAELLAEAQQRGEIGYRGDPAVLARVVYAAYQGVLGSGRLLKDAQRIADVRQVIGTL